MRVLPTGNQSGSLRRNVCRARGTARANSCTYQCVHVIYAEVVQLPASRFDRCRPIDTRRDPHWQCIPDVLLVLVLLLVILLASNLCVGPRDVDQSELRRISRALQFTKLMCLGSFNHCAQGLRLSPADSESDAQAAL